jgi:hypothetical protein
VDAIAAEAIAETTTADAVVVVDIAIDWLKVYKQRVTSYKQQVTRCFKV